MSVSVVLPSINAAVLLINDAAEKVFRLRLKPAVAVLKPAGIKQKSFEVVLKTRSAIKKAASVSLKPAETAQGITDYAENGEIPGQA